MVASSDKKAAAAALFKCHICSTTFTRRYNMKRHVEANHQTGGTSEMTGGGSSSRNSVAVNSVNTTTGTPHPHPPPPPPPPIDKPLQQQLVYYWLNFIHVFVLYYIYVYIFYI